MIALVLAALLLVQQPAAVAPLSEDARVLVAPVVEAIRAEQVRQAALPPPANDRERLERMYDLDQIGRRMLAGVDLSGLPASERQAADSAMWKLVMAIDEALAAELLTMVPPEGWFYKSVYGDKAARAAFLIVQHSNLEMWRRFVPILEPLVATGEVDGQSYGLMYDRLAVNEDRPQRYGTQMTCKNGKFVVDWDKIEDPANADARRAAIGFVGTLAQYEKLFADYPPCTEN